MASAIGNLQNLCMYSLGPSLSGDVASSLESQITGMQDLQKNQVNQAIYFDTQAMIAKTEGALQNIHITQEFLGTTLAALQTVYEDITNSLKAIMTLLNGTVSATNKEAAADGVLNTMGMIQGPQSRDAQEGTVIKTLRQSGTGMSSFYQLSTAEGAAPTADAAPPAAVSADGNTGPSAIYFNGGTPPADTFTSDIKLVGFDPAVYLTPDETSGAVATIDNATNAPTAVSSTGDDLATGTMMSVTVTLPDGTTTEPYYSDTTMIEADKTIRFYKDDGNGVVDRSQYIEVKTASAIIGFTEDADVVTALTALFTGTFDDHKIEPPAVYNSGGLTAGTNAMSGDVLMSNVPAGDFSGHAVDSANNEMTVLVGNALFSTDNTNAAPANVLFGSTAGVNVRLYLDGDSLANPNTYIELQPDPTTAAAYTGDANLLPDFIAALDSTAMPWAGTAPSTSGPSSLFTFSAGSNVGAGYFHMDYDGTHMTFQDQFGDLMFSYPVSEAEVTAAAAGSGKLEVGSIGTLNVPADYTGGSLSADLTTTPTTAFNSWVTVSGNDGMRTVNIPNLTDQGILWGASETLDRNSLINDTAYQQKVKGMLDHAAATVKEVIQSVSNTLSTLHSDERGQNASMESLHNLQSVVSEADALETANAVFENTQKYMKMIEAMYTAAAVSAKESAEASQIAKLATSGG